MLILFKYITCLLLAFVNRFNSFNIDIDYPIIINNDEMENEYFGYSFTIHQDSVKRSDHLIHNNSAHYHSKEHLYIGAPFDRRTSDELGSLRICSLNFNDLRRNFTDCQRYSTKELFPKKKKTISFHEAMTGMTMTSNKFGDEVFVCAPQIVEKGPNYYYHVGDCSRVGYEGKDEFNFQNDRWCSMNLPNLQFKNQLMCGFSASFDNDNSALLLGLPGLAKNGGGLNYFPIDGSMGTSTDLKASKLMQGSLMGYSSSFGSFISKTNYFDEKFCSKKDENRMIIINEKLFQERNPFKSNMVVGAPRFHNCKGGLIFLKQDKIYNQNFPIFAIIGQHTTSGFGYSVITSDFNNDHFNEIVVSSPYQCNRIDNSSIEGNCLGAVYIFTTRFGIGNCWTSLKLTNDKQSEFDDNFNGGFGISVASPGDITGDNLPELIVGSPWEDDGNGAIYVYNGVSLSESVFGLRSTFSQRIVGRQSSDVMKRSLLGLGFYLDHQTLSKRSHLDTGFDIDNNGVNDVMVGSILSDKIVIYRSLPIIRLYVDLINEKSFQNLNLSSFECLKENNEENMSGRTCIEFYLCFTHRPATKHYKASYIIDYNLKLYDILTSSTLLSSETENKRKILSRRLRFDQNISLSNDVNRTTSFANDQSKVCTPHEIFLNLGTTDFLSPFQLDLKVNQFPPYDKPKADDHLNNRHVNLSDYPIYDTSKTDNSYTIKFDNDCGADDICMSELKVQSKLEDLDEIKLTYTHENITKFPYININERKRFKLSTLINNGKDGESAHAVELEIKIPIFVHFETYEILSCSEPSEENNYKCFQQLFNDDGNDDDSSKFNGTESSNGNDEESHKNYQKIVCRLTNARYTQPFRSGKTCVIQLTFVASPNLVNIPELMTMEDIENEEVFMNSFNISVQLKTVSQNVDWAKLNESLRIYLINIIDLTVSGASKPEQMSFSLNSLIFPNDTSQSYNGDEVFGPELSHIYQIRTSTSSDINSLKFTINWPHETDEPIYAENGRHLLYPLSISAYHISNEKRNRISCNFPEHFINPRDLNTNDHSSNLNKLFEEIPVKSTKHRRSHRYRRDTDREDEEMERKNMVQNYLYQQQRYTRFRTTIKSLFDIFKQTITTGSYYDNKILKFQCANTTTKNVSLEDKTEYRFARCFQIECSHSKLEKNDYIVVIVHSRLWNMTLKEYYAHYENIIVQSSINVDSDDIFDDEQLVRQSQRLYLKNMISYESNKNNNYQTISTSIHREMNKDMERTNVPDYLLICIAVCILIGLMLLSLIIVFCWSLGFFHRRKRKIENHLEKTRMDVNDGNQLMLSENTSIVKMNIEDDTDSADEIIDMTKR
ncbi:hypothetical protein SNEBB_000176 [Seison nebaliae]|nr:hypothetical protein SNEBB_000176 [Seison nebaliae]